MTTLAEARTELAGALEIAGLVVSPTLGRLSPPCVVIFGDGIDPAHLARGQVKAGLRSMVVAARADSEVAIADLGEMVLAALGAIRGLADWELGTIGVDTIRKVNQVEYLTADVTAHRFVTPTV